MIANIASAMLPTTATRSASWGVSGGRLSSGVWIIGRTGGSGRGARTGAGSGLRPPVVYARRRRRRGSSGSAGWMIRRTSAYTGSAISVLTSTVTKICWNSRKLTGAVNAEQELDQRHADPGERGRGSAPGASGHQSVGGISQLAQAPGPVADRDVQQRGDAERLHRDHVDEQPDPKPDDRAEQRSGQQPHRHHHQRRDVGADAEDRDLRDRGLLEHDGHERERDEPNGKSKRFRHSVQITVPAPAACRRSHGSGSARRRDGADRPQASPGPGGC